MSKKNSKDTKVTKNTKSNKNQKAVSGGTDCVKNTVCCYSMRRSKLNRIIGFVSSVASIPLWVIFIIILLRLTK